LLIQSSSGKSGSKAALLEAVPLRSRIIVSINALAYFNLLFGPVAAAAAVSVCREGLKTLCTASVQLPVVRAAVSVKVI
jgi:hypothetical protein